MIEDQVLVPSGKVLPYLRFGNHKSAVTVFAVKDDQVLLQREYSYPSDTFMVQAPGGAIEAGESPEVAANRELIEESGYVAGKLKLLGSYYMDHRKSNAKAYVFLGTELKRSKQQHTDEDEDSAYEFIESFWMPLNSIQDEIASGSIDNAALLTAWAFYEARREARQD